MNCCKLRYMKILGGLRAVLEKPNLTNVLTRTPFVTDPAMPNPCRYTPSIQFNHPWRRPSSSFFSSLSQRMGRLGLLGILIPYGIKVFIIYKIPVLN